MTEAPISRLNAALEGRYHVERQLGEGGMATVYLARDLKHSRNVALKVLKPELAAVVGAERFLAEIQTTANLQHPHILPLFDSGEADGFLFYVMPYVEGESLRQRLDREHQLPVDEAARLASAVAGALDYAHRQGVIHRDIKPANILLHEGQPVVSDFGIALAVSHGGADRLTETGLSLGTPHYMSPEQATGDLSVGPATDIYALACVLYEMLVGEPPYTGSTPQAILGRIITGRLASAAEERPSVPPHIDAAIRKGLEKVPADRFADARDLARALADPSFTHGAHAAHAGRRATTPWRALALGTSAVALVAVALLLWPSPGPDGSSRARRFALRFEEGQAPRGNFDFLPDGSGFVYVGEGESGNGTQVWLRRWDDLDLVPIPGSEGASEVFLSPDGAEIAFYTGSSDSTFVLPTQGGDPRLVTADAWVQDWAEDGMLYGSMAERGIARFRPHGRMDPPEVLLAPEEEEVSYEEPRLLPGGSVVIFTLARTDDVELEVWSLDLASGEAKRVVTGGNPRYVSTGHLLFGHPEGMIMALPFDPIRGEALGPPVPVVEDASPVGQFEYIDYAVSSQGDLIYWAGPSSLAEAELLWVSRSGETTPVDPGWSFHPATGPSGWSLSPDGSRVALTILTGRNHDIWVKTLPDGPLDRITFSDAGDRFPVWKPGGDVIAYVSDPGDEVFRPWQVRVDGTAQPEPLLPGSTGSYGSLQWTPDGAWALVQRRTGPNGDPERLDIVGFRPGVDTALVSVIETDFAEIEPALSPDGRWLAYASNQTGRFEVFVRPFPDVDSGRTRVSVDGGRNPVWGPAGDELFWIDPERRLVSATVETADAFRVRERESLFTAGPDFINTDLRAGPVVYDVSPDGQRFLMGRLLELPADQERYILVNDFFEELEGLQSPN